MGRRGLLTALAVACLTLGLTPGAQAFNFQDSSGDWTGSLDTTIGYGQAWRVIGRNCYLIAIANGGCGYSPNIDDGDLNYKKGSPYSKAFKGDMEFALSYRDKAGIFVRGAALYDVYVMDNNTERTPLTHYAKGEVGSYGRLLDLFGWWRFGLGSMPSELRVGWQVVDWGESTFIQNGLNQINHFDVSALTTPGSELKEALLPDTLATLKVQLTRELSTELLYLFDWHETRASPSGSYFGTNDSGVIGGDKVVLGFGTISDQGVNFAPLGGSLISNFQVINRLPDHVPPNSGQYGINFKLYLPNFSQGTQLGFYFLNYTSRVPVVSFNTGTQAGLGNAWGAVNAVGGGAQATALAIAGGLPVPEAIQRGAQAGAGIGEAAAASQGGNLSAATALEYATIGANSYVSGANVTSQAQSLATNEYTKTQGYFEEFPQNIKLFGLSFNAQVQATGTALQGEVTYRHNIPLQIDDVQLVYASLTPFESGIAKLLGQPVTAAGNCVLTSATPITGCNQLGAFGLGQTVKGWNLKDMWQAQATATQSWANVFRAAQALLVFEAAVDYIPGLENQYTGGPVGQGLQYDGPGTNLSGGKLGGYPQFPNLIEPGYAFASSTSWGYVVAGRLEYASVIGSWNILPHASWSQDVKGVSPGPGGNFVEGRHAATLGVGANLHQMWDLDVSYTHYGGAGQYNLLGDRDFVAASIKFSY